MWLVKLTHQHTKHVCLLAYWVDFAKHLPDQQSSVYFCKFPSTTLQQLGLRRKEVSHIYMSKTNKNIFFQVTFHWHWIYGEAGENSEHCPCHCKGWRSYHWGKTGVQREGDHFLQLNVQIADSYCSYSRCHLCYLFSSYALITLFLNDAYFLTDR